MKVLCIEDNLSDMFLMKYHLSTFISELKFDHEKSLEKGIAAAKNQYYDLVFLDLGLPDSIGVMTIKNFRKEITDMPVIICSGDPNEHIKEISTRAGANSFLYKNTLSKEILETAVIQCFKSYNQSCV